MKVKIITKENTIVEVEKQDLKVSVLLKMMMDGIENDGEEIPLYNVPYNVFLKVLDFTKHHNEEPMTQITKPLRHDNRIDVQDWYIQYVSGQNEESLFELLEAATYLDIEPLQELVCAKIASLIKGLEPDELKQIFGFHYE